MNGFAGLECKTEYIRKESKMKSAVKRTKVDQSQSAGSVTRFNQVSAEHDTKNVDHEVASEQQSVPYGPRADQGVTIQQVRILEVYRSKVLEVDLESAEVGQEILEENK